MSTKCFFCKHERGPIDDVPEACCKCKDYCNFEPIENMRPIMAREYELFKREEAWINDRSEEFDRATALAVLKAISKRMYPSHDLFGNGTLVIKRDKFEAVRKKFLG